MYDWGRADVESSRYQRSPTQAAKNMYFIRARITVCIAMGSQKKYLEALYMAEREEINRADP